MSWTVEWTPSARRDMARLPAKVAGAVLTYVDERLAHNPARLSKPLSGDLLGLRSARNGDYRVLFELDDDAAVIAIVHIEPSSPRVSPPRMRPGGSGRPDKPIWKVNNHEYGDPHPFVRAPA